MSRHLDPATLPVVGALDLLPTEAGVLVRRLPRWTAEQITDSYLGMLVSMPAGACLRFRTDSRTLELDVVLTGIHAGELPATPVTFDLVVDGELVETIRVEEQSVLHVVGPRFDRIEMVPGDPATASFVLPGSKDSVVEVWLPHRASLVIRDARVDDGCGLDPVTTRTPRWVHYGSSISQCMEAPSPTHAWPTVVARRTGHELVNLSLGGNCMLDPFVARTIRDLAADVISLKVGINIVAEDVMRERMLRPVLEGFLDTVRDGHATTPLIVITAIHCPPVEERPGPLSVSEAHRFDAVEREVAGRGTLSLARVREVVEEVVARRARHDPNLHLVDGRTLLGPADAARLPDDLHPDPEGIRLIAERFEPILRNMAGSSANPSPMC